METERTIGPDWVARHDNRFFQVTRQSGYAPARAKVVVCEEEDARLEIRYRGKRLKFAEITERPGKPKTKRQGAASPAGAATGQPPVAQGLPEDAGAISGVGRSCGKCRKACNPKCRVGPRFVTACYRLTGLTRPRQKPSAASPCRLARPRPSGAPGGGPPDPFDAPHPLRYPLVPPFSSLQIVSDGAGPSRTYFHKPARSLRSLTRKKFLTGAPAPSPSRFHP
jgi:hypothetical protein